MRALSLVYVVGIGDILTWEKGTLLLGTKSFSKRGAMLCKSAKISGMGFSSKLDCGRLQLDSKSSILLLLILAKVNEIKGRCYDK